MKKSTILMEILVASTIIATVMGGLLFSFIALRTYANHANTRLMAANLARSVFENLYRNVRQDWWDANGHPLSINPAAPLTWFTHNLNDANALPGGNPPIDSNLQLDIFTYGAGPVSNYQVRNIAGRDYREVRVNITYPIQ